MKGTGPHISLIQLPEAIGGMFFFKQQLNFLELLCVFLENALKTCYKLMQQENELKKAFSIFLTGTTKNPPTFSQKTHNERNTSSSAR